jgi:ribosomal protein S18 acetylase RimI-like enzyme
MPGTEPITLLPFNLDSPNFEKIIALYDAIWGPNGERPSSRPTQLRRHAISPGFKGVVAVAADGSVAVAADGSVAGYAYGMTDLPGQWWHEHIAPLLRPEKTARYLSGSFAVTELAVRPDMRRHGLGARLLNELLAHLPHVQATLSTEYDNAPARALYERLGWGYLIDRMRFAPDGPDYVIMHRPLP